MRGTSHSTDSETAGSLFDRDSAPTGTIGDTYWAASSVSRLLVITPPCLPILFLAQEGDLAAVPGPSLLEPVACVRQAGSASTRKMRALGTNAVVQRSTLSQSTASAWLSNRFTK